MTNRLSILPLGVTLQWQLPESWGLSPFPDIRYKGARRGGSGFRLSHRSFLDLHFRVVYFPESEEETAKTARFGQSNQSLCHI